MAVSEVSKYEVFEAELFLTPKCVRDTVLCVRVDLMFGNCMLGKTTFSSFVGLNTVNYTAVCVYRRPSLPAKP
jgi:hypothetical protein